MRGLGGATIALYSRGGCYFPCEGLQLKSSNVGELKKVGNMVGIVKV